MTPEDSVLAIKDVVVTRGNRRILDGVTMNVPPDRRVLIRGESGAGKTTLFQLLGLLATPDAGSVIVNGVIASDLSESERARIRRDDIGLIFQDFQLIPDLTAWENAVLPQQHAGNAINEEWIGDLFDVLGIVDKSEQYPATLSGGEKQRVAIARALANQPSVIIADEPTGQLDPETAQQVVELLLSVHENSGAALVVVSHDTMIGDQFDRTNHLLDGSFGDPSFV